jgi:hypothetical protein
MKYAALDKSREIGVDHVHSALELWRYCDRSAAHLFGRSVGDRDADMILQALRNEPKGMKQSELRRVVFGDHRPAAHVAAKLAFLNGFNLIRSETEPTSGRPAKRWFAVKQTPKGSVKSVSSVKSVMGVESPSPDPDPRPSHADHPSHAENAFHTPLSSGQESEPQSMWIEGVGTVVSSPNPF